MVVPRCLLYSSPHTYLSCVFFGLKFSEPINLLHYIFQVYKSLKTETKCVLLKIHAHVHVQWKMEK